MLALPASTEFALTVPGNPFSRGQIYHLLTNPVYLGLIRHKAETFPGLHPAIIDQDLWDQVQDHLKSASARKRGATAGQTGITSAPLKGKVRDETGDLLTPSHTRRRGKRLRYYISNRLVSGGTDPTAWRLPAQAFEDAVVRAITDHLRDHATRHAVLGVCAAATSGAASTAITNLAVRITTEGAPLAISLISKATLGPGRLQIQIDRAALARAARFSVADLSASLSCIDVPFTCRRRGVETRILAGNRVAAPDQTLIRALRNAHSWSEALRSGTPLRQLALREGHSERYLARIITLISLSPRIQGAILNGTQPVELSLENMMRGPIPLDWATQDQRFGIGK